MSAERLREAAKVLRERAEAAQFVTTTGPWKFDGFQVVAGAVGWMLVATTTDDHRDDRTAAYIATMHPGVGLALADWLELVGAWIDEGLGLVPPGINIGDAWADVEGQAHKVADLILGGTP